MEPVAAGYLLPALGDWDGSRRKLELLVTPAGIVMVKLLLDAVTFVNLLVGVLVPLEPFRN